MNIFKKLSLAAALSLLAACSTMTPTVYAPNADTNVALRKFNGASVNVASMVEMQKFDAGCRLVGPVQASGNRSIAQFVQDSFNDEFKFAAIYGNDASSTALEATLNRIAFSSTSGLTHGWWDFDLVLKNPKNGKSVATQVHYEFKSGFDAMTACIQTAQALTPAVQQLIKSAVTQPGFPALIGR